MSYNEIKIVNKSAMQLHEAGIPCTAVKFANVFLVFSFLLITGYACSGLLFAVAALRRHVPDNCAGTSLVL